MFHAWWHNPRTALRLTAGMMVTGGLLAGLGTYLRDRNTGGNDQWTYYFDTAGLLLVVVGAALDFRASGRIAEFRPELVRRRALLLAILGVSCALGACLVLGWVSSIESPVLRGILASVMTAAIGAGLAGFLHIGWFSGGGWLERRIEQRTDEEW